MLHVDFEIHGELQICQPNIDVNAVRNYLKTIGENNICFSSEKELGFIRSDIGYTKIN
jgi:hypothetical protein